MLARVLTRARPQRSLSAQCFSTASAPRTKYTHRTTAILAGIASAGIAVTYQSWNPVRADESSNARAPGVSTVQPSGQKLVSFEEVQKHNKRDDCWVIIDGKIYDVTDFLENHPGGAEIIIANAGKDATKIFKPLHPPDALDMLDPSQHLGPVDPTTMPEPEEEEPTEEDLRMEEARKSMPGVDGMLLVQDFEDWAEKVMSGTAWNYYKSAADREKTAAENEKAFDRYFFRPRILRDATTGSTETEFMGMKTTMPVFISPAAMAKLGNPLGEVNLTRGAGACGIVQGISINASCSLDEIMTARKDGQPVMFQIYLNKDRAASIALLKKVTALGANAIIFTVDTAWRSKRTMDVRAKAQVAPPPSSSGQQKSASPLGVSQAISGYQDTNLTWKDIDFIREHTNLPIIVKGVQCVEDVDLCAKAGVQGVILSNHGGRQCDYAPAPIDLLYELRCNRPDLFDKIEVMMDGGVRSGADVVKAIALGAKAVGIGRSFLYANGTHGEEGVVRLCQILAEEITNTMRNIGAPRLEDLKPEMVGPAGPWVGNNVPPYVKTQ
ncbi:L-mandelate dehydrogenase [Cryptococcus neoformans Tu259-1]|uniref:L-lactate dehydrogenase (cytochrome) n=1 Tax=Cryptococcus neoformans Tu259-1 TaxID=1230072 RepID=A0A854QKL3_CRYNE|nr:L-mandelate dehydrogenase [Cryptococcus neoformans var. grubii AD1-83a]OWZ57765.1 L-mandelate dehydrogenase [Cryptococcus neoformans var. grubii 125.91]OXG21804.1 L-mandelate dehydrogenase [Cryptococcus neoformans var. grubii Tu259-1]OXG60634.1 L-mandelate dehydrogenase [Cryptococcus neoformans var. grubii MW-RSA1955]OXG64121.1 L-mandelate dehydrogenase [Cryptococcus neoformans var. grubii c8]OXG65519.1 L-mandelate dehydrogenase [Cryptococcus neoformans var. grubii CHC193]OXH11932.1 L-mand